MDGCHPSEILTSMWSGRHQSERSHTGDISKTIKARGTLRSPGLFISDSPIAIPIAQRWLEGEAFLSSPSTPGETKFASLVQQGLEQWIPKLESYPWLWIHSRGLLSDWDAPYEYRCAMCDEGDPLPPRDTNPPILTIDEGTDPDVAFGWACGAGAQAMVIDEVWEWLESALQELGLAEHCLLGLAGVLGYPLGEHGQIGWRPHTSEQSSAPKPEQRWKRVGTQSQLFAEHLHTPLILRPGGRLPLGLRLAPFVQPHHMASWIESWIESDAMPPARPSDTTVDLDPCRDLDGLMELSGLRPESWPGSHRLAFASDGAQNAIMVPGWSALWDIADEEDSHGELFAMPDDRWQQNEIRSRAPDILRGLRQLKNDWLQTLRTNPSEVSSVLGTMDESFWRPDR
jgi:hypothetical protein